MGKRLITVHGPRSVYGELVEKVVHLPVRRGIENLESHAAAVETGVVTRREGTVRKASPRM